MKIGKTRLKVVGVNIAELDVEAIVNPANNMLWMGGGISSEIRKAGGDSIETEAMKKAPSDIGEAVVTGAGKLNARWIIHAVISEQNITTSEKAIRKAVTSCLSKANEIGCKSLAFPMLTLGAHDLEMHIVTNITVDETVKYLVNEKHSLENVVFVDRDKGIREIFNMTLLEKFTKHV